MVVDLTGARARAAAELVDRCTIVRPSTASFLDEATMTEIPGDPTVLHEDLACLTRTLPRSTEEKTEGGQNISRGPWRHRIPAGISDVQPGDVVTLTVCGDDPSLVGRPLIVDDVASSSRLVTRVLWLVEPDRRPVY